MVEFIRDVVIVVAVLVALLAFAPGPVADSDAGRNPGEPRAHRSGAATVSDPADSMVKPAAGPHTVGK